MKRTGDGAIVRWALLLVLMCPVALGTSGCKKNDTKKTETKQAPGNKAKAPVPTKMQPVVPPPAKPPAIMVEKVGLMTPECALYEPTSDLYLVSNINGSPFAKDDNGFISRVAPDGKVKDLKWIDGAQKGVTLNAPKGMAIVLRTLYVADIDVVRMFDLESGKPMGSIPVPDATFLNDLYANGEDLYVSDSGMKATPKPFSPSGTDAVWKMTFVDPRAKARPTVEKLIKDPSLGRPNGLLFTNQHLWVVSFGSGELYRVEKGKKARAVKLPKGSLDGIVVHPDGQVLISSWGAKAIYAGSLQGPFKEVVTGIEAPADLGWDSKRKRLLIPLFMGNALRIEPMP